MSNSPQNTNSESQTCPICTGHGWVCEDHPDKPWSGLMPNDFIRCCGGAGMPCECNKMDENEEPLKTGMQSVYVNKNGMNQ